MWLSPFSLTHKKILIPWAEIRAEEGKNIFGYWMTISLGKDEITIPDDRVKTLFLKYHDIFAHQEQEPEQQQKPEVKPKKESFISKLLWFAIIAASLFWCFAAFQAFSAKGSFKIVPFLILGVMPAFLIVALRISIKRRQVKKEN